MTLFGSIFLIHGLLIASIFAGDWPTSPIGEVDKLPNTGCRFFFAVGEEDIKNDPDIKKDEVSGIAKITGEDCFFVTNDTKGFFFVKDYGKSMERIAIRNPKKLRDEALGVVLAHCGSTYIEHEGHLGNFMDLNKTVAIFGVPSSDLETLFIVAKIIKDIEGYNFGFTFSQEIMTRLRPGLNKLLYIKNKVTKETNIHEGAFTLEELMYTLEKFQNPMILKFDREDSPSTILGREIPCLFLIDHHTDSRTYEIFQMAANKLRNEISFVHGDPESGIVQRLINYLKINNELGNGLWIVKAKWGRLTKYKFPFTEITVENIQKFIELYDKEQLPIYYHSEEPPAQQTGPVIEAVASTFKELVMDNDYHVFVDFYGIFCGHCHTFAPVFEELANRMSSMPKFRFVKIEMSKNEVENEPIQEYPTLKLYPAGKKNMPIWFGDQRTLPKLIEFIKNSVPDESYEDI